LMKAVLAGAGNAGAGTELVDVCRLDIRFCTGCGICYEKGICVHDDDFAALHEMMLASDGIVLGSPNYINSVTAQMKALFDRMADSIHCQLFSGKYGCSVCTAGGSKADEVADYMNDVLLILGASTVGRVGVVMGTDPDALALAERTAYDLGKVLAAAIEAKVEYPLQEQFHREMRERMRTLVVKNKDSWDHEYRYWQETGWP
jgi:multimeric flavodoxin WrbA